MIRYAEAFLYSSSLKAFEVLRSFFQIVPKRGLGTESQARFRAKPQSAFLSVINIMHDYRALLAAVLKVGGGNYHTVMAEKLPSLHLLNFTAHKHIRRSKDQKLIVLDIKTARAADDLMSAVYLLGHILYMMTADLTCHIPLVSFAVGIVAFCQLIKKILKYSHINII